jgi:hypothetical protein
VILNRRVWSNVQWSALGIGIYDGFAVMWVGSEADPTTGKSAMTVRRFPTTAPQPQKTAKPPALGKPAALPQ